jgi:hypothetical protein
MLGVHERRNRNTLSTGSMAVAEVARDKAAAAAGQQQEDSGLVVLGEVPLVNFYNDGGRWGLGWAAWAGLGFMSVGLEEEERSLVGVLWYSSIVLISRWGLGWAAWAGFGFECGFRCDGEVLG